MHSPRRLPACFLLLILLAACQGPAPARVVSPSPGTTGTAPGAPAGALYPRPSRTPAASAYILPGATARSSSTLAPTPAPSQTPIAFYEPAGCQAPPDSMERVEVNGWTLTRRTLAMLQHAQALYGGPIDLTSAAITQGSYHDNGSASFGTHLGGGAVDLAIFQPGTWTVDFAGLPHLVSALRAAGFAAWVRDLDEVFPGSGYHIHAIAVGDPELSSAAEEQLSGPYGYFRGYNGLPQADGAPVADRDGPPVLCGWMASLGYRKMRDQPVSIAPSSGASPRLEQLAQAAQAYQSEPVRLLDLARQQGLPQAALGRALAWTLWKEAGLLPPGTNPANRLATFVNFPVKEQEFWGWLPADYEHLRFDGLPGALDFADLPLQTGDLLYLRAADPGESQLQVVIADLPVTVLSVSAAGEGWQIQPVPLVDLLQGGKHWSGVDVLRARGLRLDPPFSYTVQPGDSLPGIAARFGASLEALARRNPGVDLARLVPGSELVIGQ